MQFHSDLTLSATELQMVVVKAEPSPTNTWSGLPAHAVQLLPAGLIVF